jgi:hypothetical protein
MQCPDGLFQIVFTKGVAMSITGCRLKTSSPGFTFIGILAGRPVQHDCTLYLAILKHAELMNAVFSMAGGIHELP